MPEAMQYTLPGADLEFGFRVQLSMFSCFRKQIVHSRANTIVC